MKTAIIGAGSDLGVHIDGAKYGPGKLINDIISTYTGEVISLIQDDKIIKSRNLSDRRKNEYEIDKFNSVLYQKELELLKKDLFPITLGGDHTVAIASTLADCKHKDNPVGLIWIDAHTDFNTFKTTITGNIHGLPCAAICGYECDELRKFHDGEVVNEKNVVIVGARSIDPKEKENLKYSNVTVYSTEDLREKGIKQVMEEAFQIAKDGVKSVHISYDIDVIDPNVAPGVSVPEVDGINEEEAMEILDEVLNRVEDISSMDIVEFNPLRDIDRKTEQIALNILATTIQKIETKKGIKKKEEKKY